MKKLLILSLLPLACTPTASNAPASCPVPSPVNVATIDGKPITQRELDEAAARQLYEVRQNALDQMITDRLLDSAAAAAHLGVDDWIKREVEKRAPEATPAEAKEFYEKNKGELPPELQSKSWEELQPTLVRALTNERRKHAAGELVEELRQKAHVKVLLTAPRVDVAATGPARGPEKAKVTIVEFSDFQCPYCARAEATVEQVMKQYDGKIRLVYRDYPLPFHEHAQHAAEAGQCAQEQGKFWPLHDWMFAHQDQLADEKLSAAAAQLGLDGKRFDACLSSHKYSQAVSDNQAAGEKAGVNGTPAFFINGELISGAQPFEKFQEIVERELAR